MKINENLKSYSLNEIEYYKVHGRTDPDSYPLPLFFNGSGVEVNVTGSELWIDLEVDYDAYEPWIYTTVNGAFMSRQMLSPGIYSICLFRNMNPSSLKNINFIRELQAMSADDDCHILVKGFQTDGTFQKLQEKQLKLEFIGDSITSGEGTYGAKEDDEWLAMYMSSSRNYATMTARALQADYQLFSQGGWGVYTGWNNDNRANIPSKYEALCGFSSGKFNELLSTNEPYDFANWIPDGIVINLGTNDASAFEQPPFTIPETGEICKLNKKPDGSYDTEDLMKFEQAVIDFLIMIRKHNKTSHIVWTLGMLGNKIAPSINNAIHSYSEAYNDNNIAFLELPNTLQEDLGSHQHPGVKSHEKAAKVLTEYFQNLWKL